MKCLPSATVKSTELEQETWNETVFWSNRIWQVQNHLCVRQFILERVEIEPKHFSRSERTKIREQPYSNRCECARGGTEREQRGTESMSLFDVSVSVSYLRPKELYGGCVVSIVACHSNWCKCLYLSSTRIANAFSHRPSRQHSQTKYRGFIFLPCINRADLFGLSHLTIGVVRDWVNNFSSRRLS